MIEEFPESSGYQKGCGCLGGTVFVGFSLLVIIYYLALPQPNRAKQSEVKGYVGSMNRAQQAYFLDNTTFTNNIDRLGLGIKTETENYKYSIRTADKAAFHYAVARLGRYTYRKKDFWPLTWTVQEPLRSYVGGVFLGHVEATGEPTTLAILCEANVPGSIKPADPSLQNGVPTCGKGTTDLSK